MTARIEEIRIQNFRAIENVRLALSDITFLVGQNGAGKSTILDAVELVREAITDSLPTALNRRGGFEGVHRKGAEADEPLGLAVVMRAEILGRTVRMLYGFELTPGGRDLHVREALRVAPTASMGFVRVGDDFEAAAAHRVAIPKGRLVLPLVVSEGLWEIAFDTLAQMRTYEIAPHLVAEPALPGNTTNLDRAGRNAGDVLEEIELRPAEHDAVNGYLGAVAAGVVRVGGGFERGKRIVTFQQRVGDKIRTFYADQMSQGTLRALGMLLALHQRPEPSLVLIDEVEDSIHPGALDAILEDVEISAERFPVVLTTHSTEVLDDRRAKPDRVRIVQWKDGVTSLYPLSEGTVASIDRVTSAGDLLRINGLWAGDTPERFAGGVLELGQ
jgi:predicted ATPase